MLKPLIEPALRIDGLSYYAKVTTATDATHFKADDLAGYGDDFFGNNKWYVFVVRDAGGASAAPDGEIQPITDYTSSDGTFAHTAFTAPLDVTDEVLILHESIASVVINTVINNIFDLVNAILTLTETGGTLTTDGTVQNLYINNAPAGVFSPKKVQVDFTNQTATETVIIRESYRIKSGGGYIEKDAVTFAGVQSPLLKNVILEENRFGTKVTIEKTGGTNRDYDWEVFYKI
jgi:hypothetical protein